MEKCPKCNNEINANMRFCSKCGFDIKKYEHDLWLAKYEDEEKNKIVCTECGEKLDKEATYCTSCGKKIKSNEERRIEKEKNEKKLKNCNVGDEVIFGSYYIKKEHFKQPLEWIVLDKKENKALLISKYIIDSLSWWYDISVKLREWLNKFTEIAFAPEEQKKILNTKIHIYKWYDKVFSGYKDPIDKLFLLSKKEVKKYFPTKEERKCFPLLLAMKKFSPLDYKTLDWWTRSKGKEPLGFVCVSSDGWFYECFRDLGSIYHYCGVGIRPALWVNLE